MLNAGVQAVPFYKVNFIFFANRLNYRNHRKILVVDGITAYVGGINVSDKYCNNGKNQLYWRDTHLLIKGLSVMNLQYIFLTDWNFCAGEQIQFSGDYFPVSPFSAVQSPEVPQSRKNPHNKPLFPPSGL